MPPRDPLDEIASWAPQQQANTDEHQAARSTGFDLEAFIAKHLKVRRKSSWDGSGEKWELEVCPFNPDHNGGCAVITRSKDRVIGFKCQHNSCVDKHWKDVRALFGKKGAPAAECSGTLATRCVADIEARPVDWLWKNRIPRGKLSILAGHPGLGKSQVTASLAAIVTTGGSWPVDRTSCVPGSVIFLTAEDDAEDTLRPRLEAAGADLTRVHIIEGVVVGHTGDGAERRRIFSLEKDVPALDAKLSEIEDAALMVIDPLSAYLGKIDSHVNAEVRGLLAPLCEIAAGHKAAVVGIMHLNKGVGSEVMTRVSGAIAFLAAARASYLVAPDPGDKHRRLLLPIKCNLAPVMPGLAYSIESTAVQSPRGMIGTSRILWDATPVSISADEALEKGAGQRTSSLDEAQEWLKSTLAAGPMLAKDVIAAAAGAGISGRTLRRAREALRVVARKDTGPKGLWVWSLPLKDGQKTHTGKVVTLATLATLQDQLAQLVQDGQTDDGSKDVQHGQDDNISTTGNLATLPPDGMVEEEI